MTAKAKAKKDVSFWSHEYTVTKVTPTGDQAEIVTVLGSRDALAKQREFEIAGFFAIVLNTKLNREEYRTPGCEK